MSTILISAAILASLAYLGVGALVYLAFSHDADSKRALLVQAALWPVYLVLALIDIRRAARRAGL